MRYVAVLSIGFLAGGCMLDRSSLGSDPATDAATPPIDAGAPRDSGPAPVVDAGPVDAGAADAGRPIDSGPPPCTADRCDGDVARICVGGVLTEMPCAPEGRCVESDTGARCEPYSCTPGATACSADGTAAETCNASGTELSSEPCSRGCVAPGTCRPPTPCDSAIAATLRPGDTMTFNTCGESSDDAYLNVPGHCTVEGLTGSDVMLRLDIARAGRYRITATDAHPGRSVDPVVYVRTACADRGSQLGCDDDGGEDRSALLELDLAPGGYFLVVDSYQGWFNSTYLRCGRIAVSVAAVSP